MKIGVIGAGNIGGTLARKWVDAGHEVTLGVRDVKGAKVRTLIANLTERLHAATIDQAAEAGEVVVFAIPGAAMAATVGALPSQLDGKTVVDATNNLGAGVMNSIDVIRRTAPAALLYRAFNSLPWETYADPELGGAQADLFYCGPADGDAVDQLIRDVGLRPIRVGDLQWVHVVDALGGLSFALSQQLGRRLAFNVVSA